MTKIQAFKERAAIYGADTLTDDELLTLVSGIPIDKAKDILRRYTLQDLLNSLDTLDLTVDQKIRIECVITASRRFTRSAQAEKRRICSPDDIGPLLASELQFKEVEVCLLALLDVRNRLVRLETLSTGTNNTAIVFPRDVVRLALKYNANSVILGHNHPSGDLTPSVQDKELTETLSQALQLVNIRLIDHFLVGNGEFLSMRREGHFNG